MATLKKIARKRTRTKDRTETPVDSRIREAAERINYVPTIPSPPPHEPRQPDPELHSGLVALTGRTSELLAMLEHWEENPEPERCKVTAIFEQLSELNLEIWRLRWDGNGLSNHTVAS